MIDINNPKFDIEILIKNFRLFLDKQFNLYITYQDGYPTQFDDDSLYRFLIQENLIMVGDYDYVEQILINLNLIRKISANCFEFVEENEN